MRKIILFFLLLSLIAGISVLFLYHNTIVATFQDIFNVKPQQYYGATVDMSQILPGSQNYVLNSKGQDLIDLAANLGINVFRITNITSITSNKATSSYSHRQWAQVLQKMQSKGIYALILVEGNSQDVQFHDVTLLGYYVNFVKNYVSSGVCNFPNVIGVDIANEPALNPYNLTKLKAASEEVKSACPNTKVTIGSWRTDSGQRNPDGSIIYNWHDPKEVKQINAIVDMISVHIYGFDKPFSGPYPDAYTLTTGYLKEIRKYTTKPIFIEEFGAGNGSALTDQNTIGSPDLQKSAYEGVLKAAYDFRNKGVFGATAYLFYPRSQGIDSWSFAVDNLNTLLPAAYTFATYTQK